MIPTALIFPSKNRGEDATRYSFTADRQLGTHNGKDISHIKSEGQHSTQQIATPCKEHVPTSPYCCHWLRTTGRNCTCHKRAGFEAGTVARQRKPTYQASCIKIVMFPARGLSCTKGDAVILQVDLPVIEDK